MGRIIYKDLNSLTSLQNTTYILAAMVVFVALGIAFIISNLIAYEGGLNAKDHRKRTWGYWVTGIIVAFSFFAYNHFFVSSQVALGFRPDFQETNYLTTGIVIGGYIILGLILKTILRKKKFGTIKFWFK